MKSLIKPWFRSGTFLPVMVDSALTLDRYWKMKYRFKEETTFDQRKKDADKIKEKYPQRIPVIVERFPKAQIADIDKHKFLVPSDISVAQFIWIIRKRIHLPADKSLFLFVGKIVPQTSSTIGVLYEECRDEDGFLYAAYSGESMFGQ